MPTLEARGVEIAWSERGEGQPVLLIHETAADAAVWEPVGDVAGRAGPRDLPTTAAAGAPRARPTDYRRTTVEEQSEDAAVLLESAAAVPAVVAGAGVGAVIALDLLLRRPELVAGDAADRAAGAAAAPGGDRGALPRPQAAGGCRRRRRGRDRPLPLGRPAARSGRG